MRLTPNIWTELGALAQHVAMVNHDDGIVHYRDGTTAAEIAQVQAVLASHAPDAPVVVRQLQSVEVQLTAIRKAVLTGDKSDLIGLEAAIERADKATVT